MNPGRSRWLFRIAILVVLGLALLLWFSREQGQNVLVVENRSGWPVIELQVTVGGATNTVHDLANGADVTAALRGGGDERFVVKGRLDDGKDTTISGRGRLPEGATLTILPGGQIQIRQPGKS
jgi:hypothetical protein